MQKLRWGQRNEAIDIADKTQLIADETARIVDCYCNDLLDGHLRDALVDVSAYASQHEIPYSVDTVVAVGCKLRGTIDGLSWESSSLEC